MARVLRRRRPKRIKPALRHPKPRTGLEAIATSGAVVDGIAEAWISLRQQGLVGRGLKAKKAEVAEARNMQVYDGDEFDVFEDLDLGKMAGQMLGGTSAKHPGAGGKGGGVASLVPCCGNKRGGGGGAKKGSGGARMIC